MRPQGAAHRGRRRRHRGLRSGGDYRPSHLLREHPHTTGIRHVLVNGTFVVRDAQLVRDALPRPARPRPAYTAQKPARPAGCGPRRRGDAVALGAHSGSPAALIATSAKSLSARIGVAPYLPAKYLRPIASSTRGLRSESAYSLLAPS